MAATNLSELPKGRKALIAAALMLTTFCIMGDFVIIPITGHFYEMFEDTLVVNFMVSGSFIVGAFVFILAGWLVDRFNKKTILIIGLVIYMLTATFGAVIVNIYYMTFCRIMCMGVAYPLIQGSGLAIIAQMYPDEATHGKVVGFYNSVMAIMGAICAAVGGMLAVNGWQLVYNVYWFTIVIIILCIIVLPSIPSNLTEADASGKQEKAKGEKGWYKNLIPLLIMVAVMSICYMTITYLISVFVIETGTGDEAFTGALSSAGTIVSCICCAAFGFIYAKLRGLTPVIACALMGVGFICMTAFPQSSFLLVCCAIMGGAWGIFFSYFWGRCTEVVPENMQGSAIGIVGFVYNIFGFLCTYLTMGLADTFFNGSILPVWPMYGIASLLIAAFALFLFIKGRGDDNVESTE